MTAEPDPAMDALIGLVQAALYDGEKHPDLFDGWVEEPPFADDLIGLDGTLDVRELIRIILAAAPTNAIRAARCQCWNDE